MKVKYKYIEFEKIDEDEMDETRWACKNRKGGAYLGRIEWYQGWRRHVYIPYRNTEYSEGCLRDIADFLKQLQGG